MSLEALVYTGGFSGATSEHANFDVYLDACGGGSRSSHSLMSVRHGDPRSVAHVGTAHADSFEADVVRHVDELLFTFPLANIKVFLSKRLLSRALQAALEARDCLAVVCPL
jgi:hypothetical protein